MKESIEKFRTELEHCIVYEPNNHKEILRLSEQLDELILQYYLTDCTGHNSANKDRLQIA